MYCDRSVHTAEREGTSTEVRARAIKANMEEQSTQQTANSKQRAEASPARLDWTLPYAPVVSSVEPADRHLRRRGSLSNQNEADEKGNRWRYADARESDRAQKPVITND